MTDTSLNINTDLEKTDRFHRVYTSNFINQLTPSRNGICNPLALNSSPILNKGYLVNNSRDDGFLDPNERHIASHTQSFQLDSRIIH
jgi:hypothetical protein